jgi:hypothetical protein
MENLNRHERRRRARFEYGMRRLHRAAMSTSANGSTWAMNLQLFSLEEVLFHSDVRVMTAFLEWAHQIPNNHPLCLLCDHSWSSWATDQLPPSAVVLVTPFDDRKHEKMICVVCENCSHRPMLFDDIKTAMKKLWPDARFSSSDPPSASVS